MLSIGAVVAGRKRSRRDHASIQAQAKFHGIANATAEAPGLERVHAVADEASAVRRDEGVAGPDGRGRLRTVDAPSTRTAGALARASASASTQGNELADDALAVRCDEDVHIPELAPSQSILDGAISRRSP